MSKGSTRKGKIVTAGHGTFIEGLKDFMNELETWPDITHIRVGRIKSDGRGSGQGFTFRATRYAVAGIKTTGINCNASYGRSHQLVVLFGLDLEKLKQRLDDEGYGGNW